MTLPPLCKVLEGDFITDYRIRKEARELRAAGNIIIEVTEEWRVGRHKVKIYYAPKQVSPNKE